MGNILLSVLVPVFNEEKNIVRCLDSVFSQTVTDFEVVVVDDGSTDKTPQILASYKDPRLVVYRQENRGRVAARNKTLELSRGKYIVLQDADDWSASTRLERQLEMAERIGGKPVVGCGLSFQFEGAGGTAFRLFPESDERIRRTMARPIMAGAIGPMTMLALRSHIIEIGGWRDKFRVAAEDGDLINRLFEDSSTRFGNVPAPLYNYYQNVGSITNKMDITIPAQMFKRYCTRKRRRGLSEPSSFDDYMCEVNRNFVKKVLFKLEYHAWYLYMRRHYK